MGLGSKIKELRESFGLTQKQLGEIAGVSDKAVSTWEKGDTVPRMGAIQKLADYFGIKKSDLIEDAQDTIHDIAEDSKSTSFVANAIELASSMSEEQLRSVLEYMKFLKHGKE